MQRKQDLRGLERLGVMVVMPIEPRKGKPFTKLNL